VLAWTISSPRWRARKKLGLQRVLRRPVGHRHGPACADIGDPGLHRIPAGDRRHRRGWPRCRGDAPCMRLFRWLGAIDDASADGPLASGCRPTRPELSRHGTRLEQLLDERTTTIWTCKRTSGGRCAGSWIFDEAPQAERRLHELRQTSGLSRSIRTSQLSVIASSSGKRYCVQCQSVCGQSAPGQISE